MGVASRPTPLVGRDTEIALLTADLEAAVAGRPASVFVTGESGVGKTRLLSELATIARNRDLPVLSGAAIDVGDNAPFWPVRDALRNFLRSPQHRWALDVLAPWARGLAELVPGVPVLSAPPDVAEPNCSSALDLLVQVVMALVGCNPLIVVLDDMQWSDHSSRVLLNYLLAIVTDEPLLLAVAYRNDVEDEGGIADLALELQRTRRARMLALGPLERAAVSELVAADGRSLVDFIWQRTAGNPFLVEEILSYVRESGAWGIPDTLRDLVRARVRPLPERVQIVLRALAVGDEPVPHDLLAAVAELDEPDLLAALRTAVAANLVRVDDDGESYRLRHGIVKDVVEGDLLPGERALLHRRHAEALTRSPHQDFRTVPSLARHWECAKDWPRALSATVAAARDAERAYGFAEAQEHLLRALSLADRAGAAARERAELEGLAARAAHLAGDCGCACELQRQRLASLPPGRDTTSARLHGELGCYLAAAGLLQEAVDAHAHAVSLLPDDAPGEESVVVYAGYAEALADSARYAESRRQAALAAELANRAGLGPLRARVLPTLGFSLTHLGHVDAGLETLSEGLRLAEETGEPDDVARAHVGLCTLLCGPLNRLEEGIAAGRRALHGIANLGLSRTFGAQLQAIVANALFRAGDWPAAGDLVGEALATAPTGTAAIELRLARCRLLVGRGEFSCAERELDVLSTLCAHTAGPRYRAPLLTLRAGLAMFQGRPDLARGYVASGLEAAGQTYDDVWVLAPLVWHGLRAEADAHDLGVVGGVGGAEPSRVAALRAQMSELARRSESAAPGARASVLGYVQLCDAEASRVAGQSDPDLWAQAADTWDANTHPYPAAYCRYRQAEALFARRARAAGAVEALRRAHRTVVRLGALPMQEAMETLAKHAGADLESPGEGWDDVPASGATASAVQAESPSPAASIPTPRSGGSVLARLTERERLVLSGLVEGRTNRQIARRLFISEKTVSVHVSHILAKLEVRTRVEAAMLAHRHRGGASPEDRGKGR